MWRTATIQQMATAMMAETAPSTLALVIWVTIAKTVAHASKLVAQVSQLGARDIVQKRGRIFFTADSLGGMESFAYSVKYTKSML